MMKRIAKLPASLYASLMTGIVVLGFALWLGSAHIPDAQAQVKSELHGVLPDDVVVGVESAPIVIVEYMSMSCPSCAAFHKTVYQELKSKYIEPGTVKFIQRHYPLNEPALRAAMVTICAGKDKTSKFIDVLFELQDKWAFSNNFRDTLKQISGVGGLSAEDFEACMNDKDLETRIVDGRKRAAEELSIPGTPIFFVNGQEVKGDVSLAAFDKAIEAAEKK